MSKLMILKIFQPRKLSLDFPTGERENLQFENQAKKSQLNLCGGLLGVLKRSFLFNQSELARRRRQNI